MSQTQKSCERGDKMLALRDTGMSLDALAERFGTTKGGVRQSIISATRWRSTQSPAEATNG